MVSRRVWALADDRDGLIEIVARLLARLQSDDDPEGEKIVKVVSSGWYSPNYLLERLPAEIARTELSGRPFCIGMLRLGHREPNAPVPDWRHHFCQRLDPVEVAVASDDEALIVLYPEKDMREAGLRQLSVLRDLVDAAPLDRPFPIQSMLTALTCYHASGVDGSMLKVEGQRLLEELEASLSPVDLSVVDDMLQGYSDDRHLVDQDTQQHLGDPSTGEDLDEHDNDIYLPVAVGFAAGRRMPVSVWYDGELLLIDAVIADHRLASGKRCLDVKTERGTCRLLEQDGRWYVRMDARPSSPTKS